MGECRNAGDATGGAVMKRQVRFLAGMLALSLAVAEVLFQVTVRMEPVA